ncbi:MAG: hypothetical protein HY812_16305 [Planctomycetes bacterium]|nr:hypothetical protein [Planctomycetota bacterium]
MTFGFPVRSLALLFLLCGLAPAEILEVPLEYRQNCDDKDATHPWGSAYALPSPDCPGGDWKLPELTGARPLYATLTLGETDFLVVLDRVAEKDGFYNRIRFDRNDNGDLTDDPVLLGDLAPFGDIKQYYVSFDDEVSVEYRLGGTVLPYRLGFSLQGQDQEEGAGDDAPRFIYFGVAAACHYAASFTLDGASYQVMLGDGDCNGAFSNTARIDENMHLSADQPIYAQGDSLYLTAEKKFSRGDDFLLGDLLVLGESIFTVKVDTAARTLTLAPAQGDLVPLKLSQAPERLLLLERSFAHCVMMHRPAIARIPAGDWRLLSYALLRTGKEGDLWRLEAAGSGATPFVSAAPGAEALLEFGEPYLPLAQVSEWSLQNMQENGATEASLAFNVQGRVQEFLTDLRRLAGDKSSIALSRSSTDRPAEPTYTIVTASGENVAEGTFEYG